MKSLYPLKVVTASSAQADLEVLLLANIWEVTQPPSPRLFCPRGCLRREERKDSFVGGKRGSDHFSTFPVPALHTHMRQMLCRPCGVFCFCTGDFPSGSLFMSSTNALNTSILVLRRTELQAKWNGNN